MANNTEHNILERITELVRAIVRPILTLGGLGTSVTMIFLGITPPEWLIAMTTTMVGFWFAERIAGKH